MICFCACFHISLIWERNKIRNVISILSRIFVASKQFKSFFHLFHSFSFTETQITPQFRRAISYGPDLWICFFYTLVLHFIWTSYSAALHSTFATSIRTLVSITATAFHIIFVRLTCPKAHTVWCDCIIPIALMVVLLGSLVIWNALREGHQVVLSLTSWVAIQQHSQAESHDFPIRGQNFKKSCRFVKIALTLSLFNRNWWGFLFYKAS